MAEIKTISVEDFYTKEGAQNIATAIFNLKYSNYEFGKQIDNFNLIPQNANELFSNVLNKKVSVIEESSGIFRIPKHFIHFEGFNSSNEWLFVIALQPSTFNIFEHKSGAISALDKYDHNYRNLFEWNLTVNYLLNPGQCIFFRPWLFHSFDAGLIQLFRLEEI
jgi:hypothetical protein